jgi:hypothetical protein
MSDSSEFALSRAQRLQDLTPSAINGAHSTELEEKDEEDEEGGEVKRRLPSASLWT